MERLGKFNGANCGLQHAQAGLEIGELMVFEFRQKPAMGLLDVVSVICPGSEVVEKKVSMGRQDRPETRSLALRA